MRKGFVSLIGVSLVFVFMIFSGQVCLGSSPSGTDYTPSLSASPLEGCAPLQVVFSFSLGAGTYKSNIWGIYLTIDGPGGSDINDKDMMAYVDSDGLGTFTATFTAVGEHKATLEVNYNGGTNKTTEVVTITVLDCDTTATDTTDTSDTTGTTDTTTQDTTSQDPCTACGGNCTCDQYGGCTCP